MRLAVVGLGSIARRHIQNIKTIEPSAEVVVWRQHSKSSEIGSLSSLVDRVVFRAADAMACAPDAALVTNPAALHIETGLRLGQEGVHLFIEKPLSAALEDVDELLRLCRERSLILMTGYNFRFYQPLQIMRQAVSNGRIGRPLTLRAQVGQYLPEWRPDSDYRRTVSARQDLGGGAVLELSHELDYVRWMMGEVETVSAQIDHLSDLEIDVEDTAEIILRFQNRAIGSIHLDMVDRASTRRCRIIGTEGTLRWDWMSNRLRLFSAATDGWIDLHPARAIDRNEMYLAELRHFLDCVRRKEEPIVNGEDGRRVLEIALAAKRSAEEGRLIEL